jgi:hypothetical protein
MNEDSFSLFKHDGLKTSLKTFTIIKKHDKDSGYFMNIKHIYEKVQCGLLHQ